MFQNLIKKLNESVFISLYETPTPSCDKTFSDLILIYIKFSQDDITNKPLT